MVVIYDEVSVRLYMVIFLVVHLNALHVQNKDIFAIMALARGLKVNDVLKWTAQSFECRLFLGVGYVFR